MSWKLFVAKLGEKGWLLWADNDPEGEPLFEYRDDVWHGPLAIQSFMDVNILDLLNVPPAKRYDDALFVFRVEPHYPGDEKGHVNIWLDEIRCPPRGETEIEKHIKAANGLSRLEKAPSLRTIGDVLHFLLRCEIERGQK